MGESKKYEVLIELKKGKEVVKDDVSLVIDCTYESKRSTGNMSADILSKLMRVKNQGGIRYIGKLNPFNIKYVVLYTTGNDTYWIDSLDVETGIFTYYGDNKTAGTGLHETKIHGNEILRDSFNYVSGNTREDRLKVPPFFVFEKGKESRDVKFIGLAVPGNQTINPMEWLVAIWASRSDKTRFQNYKAIFTILDTSSGTEAYPNDARIPIKWLDDLKQGKGYESKFAPKVWKNWIDKGIYYPLICKQERLVRTKNEQLPATEKDKIMLSLIYNKFADSPTDFEKFAINIALMLDDNILNLENTRPVRDGGKDGEGLYRIGEADSSYIFPFALEAKCYDVDNGVGVKEMSRLISRIKMREFGIMVTTSYVALQAYQEIVEDNHPIIVVSGKDIIRLLQENGIYTKEQLLSKLDNY